MEKFRFKFQRILEYKETIENIKKSEYSITMKYLEEEKEKLQEIENYRERLNEQREKMLKKTTINDLRFHNTYSSDMGNIIKNQKNIVLNKQEELEDAKHKLVEATKEKKILEKLKDRDYKEYTYIAKKEEEKFVDQLVSYSNHVR